MSEATLPEELLKKILDYNFSVSEEKFFLFPDFVLGRWQGRYRNSLRRLTTSPMTKPTRPSSELLLVSKRWLRIGTPLLYNAVVILEQKHTKAIAQLLTANPFLGRSIRWLRLEGGLGRELNVIAKLAPNIDSLLLSFHVRASEGVAGLRRAVALMNPTNLHLVCTIQDTKAKLEIASLLCNALKTNWTFLVSNIIPVSIPASDLCEDNSSIVPIIRND